MHIHTPAQLITDANEALTLLKEGNARFTSGALMNKDSHGEDREILKNGQRPFAVVLCCSDSRVSPEIFFDQKLGDLFVVRNAGNVVDETVLGSIEYAAEHLGTKLVVVCGHTCCGAVTAAYEGGKLPPNIQSIANRCGPAVRQGGTLEGAIRSNAQIMARQIAEDEIIRHVGVTVLGAMYDIHTGEVSWLS